MSLKPINNQIYDFIFDAIWWEKISLLFEVLWGNSWLQVPVILSEAKNLLP